MIEFQRALELTSLDESSFMNMCGIVVGCDYVKHSVFPVKTNILDQGLWGAVCKFII